MKKIALLAAVLLTGCGQFVPHDNAPGTYNPVAVPGGNMCTKTGTDSSGELTWSCPAPAQAILKCPLAGKTTYHTDTNGVASRVCDATDANCCDVTAQAQASWF